MINANGVWQEPFQREHIDSSGTKRMYDLEDRRMPLPYGWSRDVSVRSMHNNDQHEMVAHLIRNTDWENLPSTKDAEFKRIADVSGTTYAVVKQAYYNNDNK